MAWHSWISKPVTALINGVVEIKKAKHTRKLAVINNQARLATDKQSNNHEWEMANLQDKDNALRWCSFWLFALPIVITVISPEWGAKIFTNLKIVPEWFVQTLIAMIGGIWGMTELKKAAPQFIAAIQGLRK